MKKILLSGVFLFFITIGVFAQLGQLIYIINNTGKPITRVYVTSSSSDDWGSSVTNSPLANNATLTYQIRETLKWPGVNYYDVALVDESGNMYKKMRVNITAGARIAITAADLEKSAAASQPAAAPPAPVVATPAPVPPAPAPQPVATPAPQAPATQPVATPAPPPTVTQAPPPAAAPPPVAVTPPAPAPQPVVTPAPVNTETNQRAAIVNSAKKYLGATYTHGSMNPAPPMKFDCSGLVSQAYIDAMNIVIPRSSSEIWAKGKRLSKSDMKPGDIIVFSENGSTPSHVSIYEDSTYMIHSVSAGSPTGVIRQTQTSGSWPNKVLGYVTFVGVPISRGSKNLAVSELFFEITGSPQNKTDSVPVQAGSALSFNFVNNSGSDGDFNLYFYKVGASKDSAETETLSIKNRANADTQNAFFCQEAGRYRLEVARRSDNRILIDHIFVCSE